MRSIVITGASTGIGEACALRFHELGWQVFAGVRREVDGQALVAKTSDRLIPLRLDVASPATIDAARHQVAAAAGSAGIQGLVNNAGIGVGGPLEGVALDDLRYQFEVNVFGLVAVTQAFLPLLRAGKGRIVNMSSMAGKVSQPYFGPYCASKHALEALTDSLREELAPWSLHVAAVEPGVIKTPIWGKAEDQAGEMLRNASPAIRELYGKGTERAGRALARLPERGIAPAAVADAVEHALTARRPKTRYPVGKDARWAIRLRRLLGDRAFYWLMKKAV